VIAVECSPAHTSAFHPDGCSAAAQPSDHGPQPAAVVGVSLHALRPRDSTPTKPLTPTRALTRAAVVGVSLHALRRRRRGRGHGAAAASGKKTVPAVGRRGCGRHPHDPHAAVGAVLHAAGETPGRDLCNAPHSACCLPLRGAARVSGRADTPSWVYRARLKGAVLLSAIRLPHGIISTHSLAHARALACGGRQVLDAGGGGGGGAAPLWAAHAAVCSPSDGAVHQG
jgi:hypothetical protein